ncbi:MAG TPA: XdhC family protein, partial [Beijerinckiaceae bacterium]|nr:XdhC family protein [Beijerinckiaceae bacterium]
MTVWRRLAEIVSEHGAAALVTVHAAVGSTPRPAGTRMVVRPDGAFHGSIGGGQLEWQALAAARRAIAQGKGPARLVEKVLGPDLGQCCGGRVTLAIETFDAADAERLAVLAAA